MFQSRKNKMPKRQLDDKRLKNAELPQIIKQKSGRNECKSDFCIVCENFMGFSRHRILCKVYDITPCVRFKFNGNPFPGEITGYPTELTAEYILEYIRGLAKQADSGND